MCNTIDGDGLPAWPERRARRTSANAALGDFRREVNNWMADNTGKAPAPSWIDWSYRLANELSMLIPCVNESPGGAS